MDRKSIPLYEVSGFIVICQHYIGRWHIALKSGDFEEQKIKKNLINNSNVVEMCDATAA